MMFKFSPMHLTIFSSLQQGVVATKTRYELLYRKLELVGSMIDQLKAGFYSGLKLFRNFAI